MKSQRLITPLGLILSLTLLGACAKKNDSSNSSSVVYAGATAVPNTTSPTGTTDPGVDYYSGDPGSSAPLTVDSMAVLNTYVGIHPINAPTNIRVYVETTNIGSGHTSGTIKLSYYDNNQLYQGVFSSENPNTPVNRVSYHNWYTGQDNSAFNQWFTWQGKTVFHGFFQDAYGAVILVIDGGLDLGDGTGASTLSGSVWFKNFAVAPAPQFNGGMGEQCWFLLQPSPYECGAFQVGQPGNSPISTTSALTPGNGYTRLGTFSGLNKARAFQ